MKTLAIIKPDAVESQAVGFILQMAEFAGFKIRNMRWLTLSERAAENFYAEHKGKPFFEKLVKFMASGPSVAVHLDDDLDDTVSRWREVIKSIRKVEASKEHSERNAVHGSDSNESAERELDFFFFSEA